MCYPTTNNNKPIENANSRVQKNSTIEKLSAEAWEHIVSFCNIQTTSALSRLCRFNYLVITPLLRRKIYQKAPNNCLSYSITSYKSFIGSLLENLDLETKTRIDEYLQQNQDTKNIDKIFCEFVFQQLGATAKKIRTAKGLVIKPFIKNVRQFIVNYKSNHCAIIFRDLNRLIYICQIDFPLKLKKLDTINCLNEHEYISEIQFTSENNLLVTVKNFNEKNSIKFILFQLNLANNNKIKNLWEQKINHILDYDDYHKSFTNKVIMFPDSDDKKLFLITGEKTYLFKKENSSYMIQDFIIPYNKFTPNKKIADFIFSSNGLELAVLEDYDYGKILHLFSQYSNKENFIEKSLPKIKTLSDSFSYPYSYLRDLQFNTLGDICVFIDHSCHLIMLNKIDGEWYCAMLLLDNSYFRLGLTFDEKNLILIKTHKDTKNDDFVKNLEVMSIEDKCLKSASTPCYTRKHCDITPIKYKNFYPLVEDTAVQNVSIHPSGLAVFAYNKYGGDYTVDAIIPRQLTVEEKKYLPLKKAAYYAKKIFM
jgi:isocitrate dehydrogenase